MDPERDEAASEICLGCGAPVQLGIERAYAYGTSSVLCPVCARGRGGVYDAEEDCWTVEPDLTGLPDEREPHG